LKGLTLKLEEAPVCHPGLTRALIVRSTVYSNNTVNKVSGSEWMFGAESTTCPAQPTSFTLLYCGITHGSNFSSLLITMYIPVYMSLLSYVNYFKIFSLRISFS